MTKIISCNTNGIRSAASKGFFDWLEREQADVICIQETKAQRHQLTDPVFTPPAYHCYYNDAIKPGYSGTALYSGVKPRAGNDKPRLGPGRFRGSIPAG